MASSILNAVKSAQSFLNNNNPLTQGQKDSFRNNGFALPASYQADGNGLPYNKVSGERKSQNRRNIITWFVPQFGIVRMYVNPESISYVNKKLIQKDRTKGGYTLQYWGEDLTTINIAGTTGSSGIEGINVLYELYRAEQYAFDGVGLTLAANNANDDLSHNLINGASSLFGGPKGAGGVAGSLIGGILGLDSPNNTLSPKNVPSLGQLAFTVEMYYNGWVYRGFFDNMTINEKANSFAIDYSMTFMATQRRGYRTNYLPFHRSAKDGPSGDRPHSFSGEVTGEGAIVAGSTIISRPGIAGIKSTF